jgi:hypothetical protein
VIFRAIFRLCRGRSLGTRLPDRGGGINALSPEALRLASGVQPKPHLARYFGNPTGFMVDYAGRNWLNCDFRPDGPDNPPAGCHNTSHFDDGAVQRNKFDRSFLGTNEHGLVAAIGAAIAVLQDKPALPPFSILDKKEALLMLTHFVGDLHQPLHVASAYLDADGRFVDPDAAHAIDPATATNGGNSIQDQNAVFHAEWDDIPTDIGDAWTRELLAVARSVRATEGATKDWPAKWPPPGPSDRAGPIRPGSPIRS